MQEKKRIFCVAIVERCRDYTDGEDEFEIGEIEISGEQMRILLVATAGFTLTDEEKAVVKPVYVRLMNAWRADPSQGDQDEGKAP